MGKMNTEIKQKAVRAVKNHSLPALAFALLLLLMNPIPAYAMHIAEGILPAKWAGLWYAVAAIFVVIGVRVIMRKTRERKGLLPLLGLAGAAIFLISVFPVPVPISGTTSHPCGTPLAAILVGPFVSTVLGALALLIQALFLAHGGLTTWGANILSMAVAGSFFGFGAFVLLKKLHAPVFVAAFVAGLIGDWATYAVTSFELASALHDTGSLWSMFGAIALAFAPTQLPLGILEAFFTGGVVVVIHQRRPDLLKHVIPLPIRKAASTTNGVPGL